MLIGTSPSVSFNLQLISLWWRPRAITSLSSPWLFCLRKLHVLLSFKEHDGNHKRNLLPSKLWSTTLSHAIPDADLRWITAPRHQGTQGSALLHPLHQRHPTNRLRDPQHLTDQRQRDRAWSCWTRRDPLCVGQRSQRHLPL